MYHGAVLHRTLLADDSSFVVPCVIPELSSKRVITTELVYGIPMDQVVGLDQQTRTEVDKRTKTHLSCFLFVFDLIFVAGGLPDVEALSERSV